MKKLILLLVPLAVFAAPLTVAQQATVVDRPAEPNLVFDDDGGKVQIVPADLSVTSEKQFHGGAVMKEVQQVSVFLGSGWADARVRIREVALADLAKNTSAPLTAEMRKHGIKTMQAAPYVEDLGSLSKKPLNDLDIQRKLSEMLQNKAIPAPNASTLYVLFLSPEVVSTLGGNKAGVDYAAYHSVVNLDAGEVRYVVVPFHENADSHGRAAARVFAEATMNPTGQGWF